MPYALLMFLHVGSMFMATSLAIGPITVFVLVLRSGDVDTIRRTFRFAEPVSRAGGVFYGLGVIFGISTALNGGISLTAHWLLAAYALLGLLIVANLYGDHWMKQVARAAEAADTGTTSPELDRWVRSSAPVWSLAAAAAMTLAVVLVMVVKPDLFG